MNKPPRVVFDRVEPEIDGGRFPVKRTVGESVAVRATIFADGHDRLGAALRCRHVSAGDSPEAWHEIPMRALGNDRWEAEFPVTELGRYEYTIDAWVDRLATWEDELAKKQAAGYDVSSELLEGELVKQQAPRAGAVSYEKTLTVWSEREPARYGAWYEMFPRSALRQGSGQAGPDPNRSATLAEASERLPAIAAMGFDVVYLPPIHPIGRTNRKGKNNSLVAGPDDPGSPWAIGSEEGGHTAIEPALGTLADFDRFLGAARAHTLEVALDLTFQTSPDHPYVREHPNWFRHRPDGTIKYAENPPKRYQDSYPFDFESDDWEALWHELLRIVRFWIERGVRIFRVDNPHTKPFGFWEWLIREVRRTHLDVIFLSEAFTRPSVMKYLAKLGFTQSYTYFTWRNTKSELTEYFTELTQTETREYLRPNLFANTPDILHAYLQTGGRPAFQVRLVLAATLGASYGIYSGFELCENRAVAAGSEEYLDSEKYQIVNRDWDRPGHIRDLVTAINRIRRENRALQFNWPLTFHETDNDQIIFYSKACPSTGLRAGPSTLRPFDDVRVVPRPVEGREPQGRPEPGRGTTELRAGPDCSGGILVVVNLDPVHAQHGWVRVPFSDWHLPLDREYVVEDLLSGEQYRWRGEWNYVRLDPTERVAHILKMENP